MDTFDKLANFTDAYNVAMSVLLADKRETLPFHADPTRHPVIYEASDGFLTTYEPSLVSDEPQGSIGQEVTDTDLNTICQTLSVHHLHVRIPRLNEPYGREPPQALPDNLLYRIGYGHFLDRQFVADLDRLYAGGHPQIESPAILITPFFRLENGIVRQITPSRWKIWSPVIAIPTIGLRRLFRWTHADVWFKPEQLNLDPAGAAQVAREDLLALQTIVGLAGDLSISMASHDARTTAADQLDQFCQEFLQLLAGSGDDEATIHRWLKEPHHHLFLDADPARVQSKIAFGNKASDFVVRHSDGTYKLIEIERANLRIFTKAKAEPSAEFNHACQQVRDWQRYIRDNVRTVREELKLDGIDKPTGAVIAGRVSDIDSEEALLRWRDLKATHEFELSTYDDVCDRVRSLVLLLRRMMTTI